MRDHMSDLGDYQYVALKRLKAGEVTVQPGEIIPLETSRLYGRGKVRTLVQAGWIAPVGLAPTASAEDAEEVEDTTEEAPKQRRGGRRKRVEEPKEEQPDDVDVRGGPDELATGRDPASDG